MGTETQNVGWKRETLLVWTSVLLPPITWAVQMEINYALVRRACYVQQAVALYATTAISLALISISAVIAWMNLIWFNVHERTDSLDPNARSRFIAFVGLFSSGLFFLVTLAQGISVIFFHPCQS